MNSRKENDRAVFFVFLCEWMHPGRGWNKVMARLKKAHHNKISRSGHIPVERRTGLQYKMIEDSDYRRQNHPVLKVQIEDQVVYNGGSWRQ